MNINVDNDKLTIDGCGVKIADLNQGFLDDVVSKSLIDDVEYKLEGDHPLVKFFKALQDGTKEGSALRQKMKEVQTVRAAVEKDDSEEAEAPEDEPSMTGEESKEQS